MEGESFRDLDPAAVLLYTKADGSADGFSCKNRSTGASHSIIISSFEEQTGDKQETKREGEFACADKAGKQPA